MVNRKKTEYTPDEVSPPGATLLDVLEERDMPQAELARRMGRPKPAISEIINGKKAIPPETAIQLERVLGVSSEFWIRRERQYREFLARQREQAELEAQVEWLKEQPPLEVTEHLRHIRFDAPLEVRIDGREGNGVIYKPGKEAPRETVQP